MMGSRKALQNSCPRAKINRGTWNHIAPYDPPFLRALHFGRFLSAKMQRRRRDSQCAAARMGSVPKTHGKRIPSIISAKSKFCIYTRRGYRWQHAASSPQSAWNHPRIADMIKTPTIHRRFSVQVKAEAVVFPLIDSLEREEMHIKRLVRDLVVVIDAAPLIVNAMKRLQQCLSIFCFAPLSQQQRVWRNVGAHKEQRHLAGSSQFFG